jgi:phosphoribosylanthranilate isomerase
LLTSATSAESIIAQQRRCGTNTLQLCDYVDASVYRDLRRALPGVGLVQVIHVTGPESIERARAAAEHVQALLLDSGDTTLPVKLFGGTGRTHHWTTSRRIREAVRVPPFLAGGLAAGNAAQAVAPVTPFGLDLCSSVRTDGRLDCAKLVAFFAALP